MTTDALQARAPAPPGGRGSVDGRAVIVVVVDLAVLAWIALALTHGHHGAVALPALDGPPATHAGHSHGGAALTDPLPLVPGPALRTSGWVLMVVAMMLPPALPLLQVARRLVARRSRPGLLVAVTAVAFLAVWGLAGLGYAAGDLALRALAGSSTLLRQHPELASGLAAVAAGAYQFTPLKRACLDACRSPRGLAMTTWTGVRPRRDAALLGLRFGLVCVGCCWALMLLTFTVGVAAMPVMVLMTAVMALERLLPRFRPVVPFVGVGAIALGVLLLAGLVPPGLTR